MGSVLGPSNDAKNRATTATERVSGDRVAREGIVRATAPHLLPTMIFWASGCCFVLSVVGQQRMWTAAAKAVDRPGMVLAFVFGFSVCFDAMVYSFFGILYGIVLEGNGALLKAISNPVNYLFLNRWAHQIPALKAAARAVASGGEGSASG